MAKDTGTIQLWYIHLTPRREKRDEKKLMSDLKFLMDGPGATDIAKLMWVAKAMCGIEDHREAKWATRHQLPLAFKSRSDALVQARKHDNEFWRASVRRMRVVEPGELKS